MECVTETGRAGRETPLSAEEADAMVSLFVDNDRYVVRRSWESVCYSVAITRRGDVLPLLSYVMPVRD